MKLTRAHILIAVAFTAGACALWAASSPQSPFAPKPDRPVRRVLINVARTCLWLMLLGEKRSGDSEYAISVQAIDPGDGHVELQNARGW